MNIETVTVAEIISAARARQASLVAESAGHVVLGLARSVVGIPLRIDAAHVAVSTEGGVGMTGTARTVAAPVAAHMLRELLHTLLAASQGAPGALAPVAQPRSESNDCVEDVFAELAAALIPINRGAAKRALARLARETLRAKATGRLPARAEPSPAKPARKAAEPPCPRAAVPPRESAPPAASRREPVASARTRIDIEMSRVEPSAIEPVSTPAGMSMADVQIEERPSMMPDEATPTDVDAAVGEAAQRPSIAPSSPVPSSLASNDFENDDGSDSILPAADGFEPPPAASRPCVPPPRKTVPGLGAAAPRRPAAEPVIAAAAPAPEPSPTPEVPPPSVEIDEPAVEAEAPLSEAAAPLIEAPAPPIEAPAPLIEAPAPLSEASAPLSETAAPVIEAPAPLSETAAPVSETAAGMPEAAEPPVQAAAPAPEAAEPPVQAASSVPEAAEPPVQAAVSVPEAAEPQVEWSELPGRITLSGEPAPLSVDWSEPSAEPAEASEDSRISVEWSEPVIQRAEASDASPVTIEWSEPVAAPAEPSDAAPVSVSVEWSEPTAEALPAAASTASRVSEALVEARYRSVEALLDEFGEDASADRSRAMLEARRALKRLAQIMTPTPPPIGIDAEGDGQASWPSPVAGLTRQVDSSEPPSIPPQAYEPRQLRKPKASLFVSASLLVLGVLGVLTVWLKHPEFFVGRSSPLAHPAAGAPAAGRPADAGACAATITLRDLPSPHELLLRLGTAPLETRPLPMGVRLELMATAPGHKPRRVVVPADATWSESGAGRRSMKLDVTLEPGATSEWPAAPAGDVGGVGRAGYLDIDATPPGTELWLVANAGSGSEQTLTVSCDEPLYLMVVSPSHPTEAQRITVAPTRLQAAAASGGLSLSVSPPAAATPTP